MRRWQHRKKSPSQSTAKAEVSAWLEEVGDQLDQDLADNEVERSLNVYSKTRAADQLRQERDTDGAGHGRNT